MNMLAYIDTTDTAERRQGVRRTVNSASTLRVDAGGAVDVIVSDISATGCSIEVPHALDIGGVISIGLAGFGAFEAKVVRKHNNILGCAFLRPIDADVLANAFASPTTIVHASIAPPRPTDMEAPEPVVEKWPLGYRVLFLTGSSLLLWALMFRLVDVIA